MEMLSPPTQGEKHFRLLWSSDTLHFRLNKEELRSNSWLSTAAKMAERIITGMLKCCDSNHPTGLLLIKLGKNV